MPGEAAPEEPLELRAHWRRLVNGWAARQRRPYEADASSVALDLELPEAERKIRLAFRTTSNDMLLVLATDDRYLKEDQLALAAAAANAWNIERLAPMLSVCDLDDTEQSPYLMGIRTLPLACWAPQNSFRAMADQWLRESRDLFTWCHRNFRL
ncbi:hypothetical protein GPA10_25705 [Streptomyces sp. p1417]|uniref:Uncharacterized protein n=1 Tax=Streptomyces typhae TaxID=2681492 RepID=A0A6L6X357_9ACTN|nr:hypothetical protein [Streptomyces typhae]MVO88059.1 hypothetical protein [Streptomyces typhae]